MAETYVGKHRLRTHTNFTLRAVFAATVALIAVILIALSSTRSDASPAPAPASSAATAMINVANGAANTAVNATHEVMQKIDPPSIAGVGAGADSGKVATAGAVRNYHLETCNS